MVQFIYLLVASFAFCLPEATAKPNLVSVLVSDILNKVLIENMSLPLLKLGSDDNKLTDLETYLPGVRKSVDGSGMFGFKIKIEVPTVILSGKYDWKYIDVPGLFPLFGNGIFTIKLNKLNLVLDVKPVKDFETDKYIVKIPVINVLLNNSEVRFQNLMNDPAIAAFLNEIISSVLPDLLKVIPGEIIPKIQPLLDHYGNEIILCITTELGNLQECIKNIPPPKGLWQI